MTASQSRAFCPNGTGNGIDNSCGGGSVPVNFNKDIKPVRAALKAKGIAWTKFAVAAAAAHPELNARLAQLKSVEAIKDGKSDEHFDTLGLNCGRGSDGSFGDKNRCTALAENPKGEDPAGRMRFGSGVQTDAGRKLYQMGSSEKKISSLVEAMGGDPSKTTTEINPPGLNLTISDKSGKKLFHVDYENGRARIYPTKDLSKSEAAAVAEAASKAFPARYETKSTSFKITVFTKASDMKSWEAEDAGKKANWEEKYQSPRIPPPHKKTPKWQRSIDARYVGLIAFSQSRNCGTGSGGFQSGNTCAGAAAADAAVGAAKGAVLGGVGGFAKTFTPQGASAGAAMGAVAGAVKGIYDNQMRPTRVSARIESVGMTNAKVADLVKKLGGTGKSLASMSGSTGLSVTIRGSGGKVSHVVDVSPTKISIYPIAGRREMTDHQIDSIKEIAKSVVPKETQVVVKTDSLSYAKRLAGKGFTVAAKGAGLIIATATVSGVAVSIPDAVLGTADLIFDTHHTDSFFRKPPR